MNRRSSRPPSTPGARRPGGGRTPARRVKSRRGSFWSGWGRAEIIECQTQKPARSREALGGLILFLYGFCLIFITVQKRLSYICSLFAATRKLLAAISAAGRSLGKRDSIEPNWRDQPVYASSTELLKSCFSSHARSSSLSGMSIRSILKITGLVPSLQQAIIMRSSFVQPFMMEPP